RRNSCLLPDYFRNFPPQTRGLLQYFRDIRARGRDRGAPSGAGPIGGRGFELEQMSKNPAELGTQLPAKRFARALDLVREVPPIERQVRILGGMAQRRRLLLGPAQEIPVIEFAGVGHDCPVVLGLPAS